MTDPGPLDDILLIEDNPGDVRLTKEMFKEGGLNTTIHVVNDGTAAFEFLHRRGEHAEAPRPDLILLDWHLPRKTGGEVLTQLKNSEDLEDIPVVVLSGSGAEVDVLKEEQPRADEYITKPIDPDECLEIAENL